MSKVIQSALGAAILVLAACSNSPNDTDATRDAREVEKPMAADNTGQNAQDRAADLPVPTQQGNGEVDLKITQAIRQALIANDTLSMAAKNVKVITLDGHVALRGPVENTIEKSTIHRIAEQTAGVTRVVDLLEVKMPEQG